MRRLTRRIREIARWPRRYRTSRGFGVHSPFAFDFITKVLRDREAYYYAYPEIDSLCGKTHRDGLINNMIFYSSDYERQEARMLFRMLCRFNPAQVIEIGGGNEVSRIIIERAIPSAALHRWSLFPQPPECGQVHVAEEYHHPAGMVERVEQVAPDGREIHLEGVIDDDEACL